MISIIISTYCTPQEKLRRCLTSAASQTLDTLEIVLVDDNSDRSEQKAVRSVVKSLQKDKSLRHARDIRIVCYGENRGLVAARRTGVEEARGEYVTMLDSDDELAGTDVCERALAVANSTQAGYDIVQCCAEPHREGAYILESNKDAYKLIEHPAQGELIAPPDQFAETYITTKQYCLFLWSKLIKRETLLRALDRIPVMDCFMAEDTLFSYFLSRESSRYIGIPLLFYIYNLGQGISTSADTITSLERWRKLCTPSAVFTAIMYDLKERPLPVGSKLPDHLNHVLDLFVVRNIKLLCRVTPELRGAAHDILVESWGEKIIAQAEREMKLEIKQESSKR